MEKARRIDLCARLWHDKKSEHAYAACQRRDVISMKIRKYRTSDLPVIIELWNSVVEAGDAFPQEELLNEETGAAFFAAQSCTVVLEEDDQVLGLYILHPNNVGRCSHIANASYAIDASVRGKHLGEALHWSSILSERRGRWAFKSCNSTRWWKAIRMRVIFTSASGFSSSASFPAASA